jgi:hypothetical protein
MATPGEYFQADKAQIYGLDNMHGVVDIFEFGPC